MQAAQGNESEIYQIEPFSSLRKYWICNSGFMSMPRITTEIQKACANRLDCVARILPAIGQTLVAWQKQDLMIQTKSNHMDLVTRADLESERQLKTCIQENFPEDDILAEESGLTISDLASNVKPGSIFRWALDPVDGTINYAHGLPLFAISVGLMYGDKPVAGLIFMPVSGDRYYAIEGKGATKNESPIHCSPETVLSKSLVVTGFPYDRLQRIPQLLAGIESMLRKARGIRRTGSAAVDLCWLSEGRFEAHFEFNLKIWDTCAGLVILQEAGGMATGLDGKQYQPGDPLLVASNGHIQQEILQALQILS